MAALGGHTLRFRSQGAAHSVHLHSSLPFGPVRHDVGTPPWEQEHELGAFREADWARPGQQSGEPETFRNQVRSTAFPTSSSVKALLMEVACDLSILLIDMFSSRIR